MIGAQGLSLPGFVLSGGSAMGHGVNRTGNQPVVRSDPGSTISTTPLSSTAATNSTAATPAPDLIAPTTPPPIDALTVATTATPDVTGAGDRPASSATYVKQPGATARLDLKNWQPAQRTEPQPTAGDLLTGSGTRMRTRPGPELATWLRGTTLGSDEGGPADYAAMTPAEQVNAFVALAMQHKCIGDPSLVAQRIQQRWGEQAPQVFALVETLYQTRHLLNKDDLTCWCNGLSGPGPGGEGYATMLQDAVDMVQAGHDIYVERSPDGLGDIVDASAQVTYQHKRVAGNTLGKSLKKAVEQIRGFTSIDGVAIPGAPTGHLCVAQIDARNNPNFSSKSDADWAMQVSQIQLGDKRERFEIQILLDDRMLVFDREQRLTHVVQAGANP